MQDYILHARKCFRLPDRGGFLLSYILQGKMDIPSNSETLSGRLGRFSESAITWGAIGMLLGAIVPSLPFYYFFCLGGVLLWFSALKAKLFEGSNRGLVISGNFIILPIAIAGVMLVAYRYSPKPATPENIAALVGQYLSPSLQKPTQNTSREDQAPIKSPTAAEIAEAIAKKLSVTPPQYPQPVSTNAEKTPSMQTPAPTQNPVPVEAELQPLKTVALTLADQINTWADQRLKEAPEHFPGLTPDEQKAAAAFHDRIISEWHDRYGIMAGVTLSQLHLVWRDVLKIPVPSVHACMLDSITGNGNRGILETKKMCASFIKQAAEKLN
jgi:hypothetical protein